MARLKPSLVGGITGTNPSFTSWPSSRTARPVEEVRRKVRTTRTRPPLVIDERGQCTKERLRVSSSSTLENISSNWS